MITITAGLLFFGTLDIIILTVLKNNCFIIDNLYFGLQEAALYEIYKNYTNNLFLPSSAYLI